MNSHEDSATPRTYESRPQPRTEDLGALPAQPTPRRDYFNDPRRKSPVLALLLSLMPGVGQIYVGFYQQGFTNALIVASIIALLASGVVARAEPLFGMFLAFFWMYNVVDAWRRAVFYNNALAGIGPATLPEDFTMAGGRGSLAGGLAMVVVGGVLLSNTLFGVPLEWLERWWPVAFLVVGGWLLYPTFANRRKPAQPPV